MNGTMKGLAGLTACEPSLNTLTAHWQRLAQLAARELPRVLTTGATNIVQAGLSRGH